MTYNQELRFRQDRFAWNVQHLLAFIRAEIDVTISFGRARDIPEVQELLVKLGKSKTLNSMHPLGLSIDLNFFKGEYYLFNDKARFKEDIEIIRPAGEYWMTLDKDNRWGADWNRNYDVLDETFSDPYHFENHFP